MFPLVHALRHSKRFAPVVITTGQHRDLVAPILELAGIEPDHDLGVGHPGSDVERARGDGDHASRRVLPRAVRCDRRGHRERARSRRRLPRCCVRSRRHVVGDGLRDRGVQPADSRRARRGRPAHRRLSAVAVPGGAQPPAGRADRRIPPCPDLDSGGEPRPRGRALPADLRHRQHGHRRAAVRRAAARSSSTIPRSRTRSTPATRSSSSPRIAGRTGAAGWPASRRRSARSRPRTRRSRFVIPLHPNPLVREELGAPLAALCERRSAPSRSRTRRSRR